MNPTNSEPGDLPLVYVLGDSISIQYGPSLERALAGIFRYERKSGKAEALLNLDLPMGANAGDSSRVLDFLQACLKGGEFRPDVLLLNCGLHDIKRDLVSGKIQVSLESYRENLRQTTRLCRDAGIPLVWMRTTSVVDEIHNHPGASFHRHANDQQAYNACADEVMRKADVPVIDLYTFTRNLGDDAGLFGDHVHFNEEIREKQGVFLAGCLAGLKASGIWSGSAGVS